MPVGSKKSRHAKKRREEGSKKGRAGFAKCAPPSPNASDYIPSILDDSQQESESDHSSDERDRNDAGMSVEALQCLYSDFLPPHLQLNPDTQKKRQDINKRPAVYNKTSRTTVWRKIRAQKEAARGSGTLDAFILRKVCVCSI